MNLIHKNHVWDCLNVRDRVVNDEYLNGMDGHVHVVCVMVMAVVETLLYDDAAGYCDDGENADDDDDAVGEDVWHR